MGQEGTERDGRCSRYDRYKIIEVWEYRNVGMEIWDTKELDKTGQDTVGYKYEECMMGRRHKRTVGRKRGRGD